MGSAKTGLVLMILANLLVSEAWCSSPGTVSESAGSQSLNIYLVDVPFMFAAQGKGVATRLFKNIDINLYWHTGRRLAKDAPWAIEVRTGSAPPAASGHALAASFLPARLITIYLDRIRENRDPSVDLVLFGHVLAHEIGHVLKGESHHSPDGILKQAWTPGDYSDMLAGKLAFTAEDVRLIRLSPLLRTTVLSAAFQPGNKMLP